MSRESDFIHRTLGLTVPESDGGETMLVELTPKFLQNLSLVYKEMGDLVVECVQDSRLGLDLTKGKSYGLCSVGSRSMCIIAGEGERQGHMSIPNDRAAEFFRLRVGKTQLAAIDGLVQDAYTMRLEQLKKLTKSFGHKYTFQVGDTLMWKDGLCNCARPFEGEVGIVLEVLAAPVRAADTSSNEAGACNDIVIGILDDEGGLLHYLMDSRRFRPADQSKRGA